MSQVNWYSENNEVQKNDLSKLLDSYFQLINWKGDSEDAVLDVGCGSGGVTIDVLLPRISAAGFKKLVGIDLLEEMIKLAKDGCTESRVTFQQMDISTKHIPTDFVNAFDHVLSFYCLHWVSNQKKAIENIFKMLVSGGDTLLMFVFPPHVYKMHEALSKKCLWKPYMKDLAKYGCSHYDTINPENNMRKLLNEEGFNVKVCKLEERRCIYPKWTNFINMLLAFDPFYTRLPETLKDKYAKDMLEEFEKLGVVQHLDNGLALAAYKMFIVYARKPLEEQSILSEKE